MKLLMNLSASLILVVNSTFAESPSKFVEELEIVSQRSTFETKKCVDTNFMHGSLAEISFTETTSSPRSYIVEGMILHSNTGGPCERVPIYLSKDEKSMPVLAALTNCDGKFKFRLWVKEDARSHEIQTTESLGGYLYAMGSFKTDPVGSSGSYTQRFPLKKLIEVFSQNSEKTPRK